MMESGRVALIWGSLQCENAKGIGGPIDRRPNCKSGYRDTNNLIDLLDEIVFDIFAV